MFVKFKQYYTFFYKYYTYMLNIFFLCSFIFKYLKWVFFLKKSVVRKYGNFSPKREYSIIIYYHFSTNANKKFTKPCLVSELYSEWTYYYGRSHFPPKYSLYFFFLHWPYICYIYMVSRRFSIVHFTSKK